MTIMDCVMDSARAGQACQSGYFRYAHHHWQWRQGIQHRTTALVHVVVHGSSLPVSTFQHRFVHFFTACLTLAYHSGLFFLHIRILVPSRYGNMTIR
jgi:hypothetical protein